LVKSAVAEECYEERTSAGCSQGGRVAPERGGRHWKTEEVEKEKEAVHGGGISREGGGGSDYVNQTHQGSKRPSQGPTNMAGIKGKWAPAIEGRRLTG